MENDIATKVANTETVPSAFLDEMVDKGNQLMQRYWDENPDLYRIVQQKKEKAAALAT